MNIERAWFLRQMAMVLPALLVTGLCVIAPAADTAVIQVSVVSDAPPVASIELLSPVETGADQILFQVTFSEPVGTSFDETDVQLTGTLMGSVSVQNADPVYQVMVTLADPNADGTVGISLPQGAAMDGVGNVSAPAASPLCSVYNWRGFLQQPADMRLYTSAPLTLTVVPDCGASDITYQWWVDHGTNPAPIAGPSASQWDLNAAVPADSGDYWCVATYDGQVYSTAVAHVEVADHLTIVQQPLGGQVPGGAFHHFRVVTSGGLVPVRFQWTKDGANIPGAEYATLDLGPLSVEDSGEYSVEVSDGLSDVVNSDSVKLDVVLGLPLAAFPALAALALALAAAGAGLSRRR